jgi:four helix bundle protein
MTDDRGEVRNRASSPEVTGSTFRGLIAHERAVSLADRLHLVVARWPSFDRWSLGLQLVRAADSIGANIAEGAGRWHGPDRRRLFFVARGSLYETEHWLMRAQARQLLDARFDHALNETARALNGLIRRTR